MARWPVSLLRNLAGLFLFCGSLVLAQSNSDAALQQYADAAQSALASGHYEDAESDYRKMLQIRPDLAEIHVTLGAIYFQQRNYDQAVTELRTALKLKPSLTKAGPLLSMSLSELGRYSEAIPGLDKGFHQSADPQAKRMCGLQLLRAYTGLQENEKAAEIALELDHLYPRDAEVLYHAGKVYGNLAFLNMRDLAAVAPNSAWRHLAAAEAHESQEAYLEAISEYRAVLAIDPRRPDVHYRLGRTLLASSEATQSVAQKDEASKEFEQELEIDPANANSAYELAELDRTSNHLDAARHYFELALKDYPDFVDAQLGLAATLMSLEQPKLAVPHLEKAISINPGNVVAWYRLSLAERALGNQAEQKKALAEFQRLRAASAHSESNGKLTSPSDVTPQQLDADPPH